ncbi:caspase family protein [Accumulibacter sp.]|uniref:Filamentous hemagglutinin family outer membrane protein n=1 Tax=Accumulibacter regalis TaxID=522306 RepID=C7RQW6_ACCRE|nr:caspase family protein [Accumulibacter sp.]MBN8452682.1 caspase family protein [Accumulibacter sp.]MBO3714446.1 caspase family protein [Accumulibacter sp.]
MNLTHPAAVSTNLALPTPDPAHARHAHRHTHPTDGSGPAHGLAQQSLLLAAIGLLSLPAASVLAATALPTGGVVTAGSATISQTGSSMRIDQTSAKAVIDWRSFNVGSDAAVRFQQPSASAIVLNRVGADGGRSVIDGRLSANGQVWLLNPGGVLFGPTARVDVGGLLAASLRLGNDDFMSGNYRFTKESSGSIVNQGTLTAADGGYIALLAPEVRNEGIIAARLGTVALASGEELRVDFSGDRLIEIRVDRADVAGLIDNRNLVAADGGWVLMSTDAAGRLANGAINNSGIVRATTLSEHQGVIKLLGGAVKVAGTLDASAPSGGDGGFIETSGHSVKVDSSTRVTTAAAYGKTGNWLIDPNDYTISSVPSGGDITGPALSSLLATTSVTIQTATMGTPGGAGDIFVDDPVSWSSGNALTLVAERNITIIGNVTGTGLNSRFAATAPGTLNVFANVTGTGPGGGGGDAVRYQANNLVLSGTTTAIAGTLSIQPNDPGRSIRIEATPSAGVLSLTPTQFATLRADADRAIVLFTQNGDISVGAALAGSQIHAGYLALSTPGGNITIDAPITGGPGLLGIGLEALAGVRINSAVSTPGVFKIDTAGTLTVSSTGRVNAADVEYHANDLDLTGTTTSSAASIGIRAFDSTRAIRIESSPSAGVLSLSPAEIATLHAPAAHNIVIGWSGGGPLTVAADLDASHIDAGDLHLGGSSVVVNAPITFGSGASGLLFDTGSGGVQINAPISLTNADGLLSFQLSSGGQVRQSAAAPITARQLVATGSGEIILVDAVGGNRIGTVAADLGSGSVGDFALINDSSTGITVGSVDGVNGITAVNILLYTGGNMTLNAPIVAVDRGYGFGLGPVYTVDPLCTGTCVQPHIDLRAGGSFTNNVGASALTLPAGSFWSLITDKPSTTYLNGLSGYVVSFDGASIQGDILLSANRVFYTSGGGDSSLVGQVKSAIVTTDTRVNEQSSANPPTNGLVSAAIAPPGGLGSGGAAMSNFPSGSATSQASSTGTLASATTKTPPPPPELIVDASTTMPRLAGVLKLGDLQAISRQVHAARSQLFADALAVLAKNPGAADIPDCIDGRSELCIATPLRAADDGYQPAVRRKVALLIGNNAYRSPIPELETPINDANAIAAQLRDRLGYETRVVDNADRQELVKALNDLIRNTARNDSVLVMYSGHGYLDEATHTGYWLPTDADVQTPYQWISNQTIARALRNIPAKQVMLVSDSCYSGSLTREGKVTDSVRVSREQTLTRRSVLAFSSGGEEPVSDEGYDDHSIFAWNLIRSLEQMKEETSGQQLHAAIKAAVASEFPQVPQYGIVVSAGHAEGGEYLLTPGRAGEKP